MKIVNIIVEGETERRFIDHVLAPSLNTEYFRLKTKIIGKTGQEGGAVTYSRVKEDVNNLLKQDRDSHITTFFDFYGIDEKFPGYDDVQAAIRTGRTVLASDKAKMLETALKQKLKDDDIDNGIDNRFFPHIQVHEFEALLFSDAQALYKTLSEHIERPAVNQRQIERIISEFNGNPEEINDNPNTAPSKRIYGRTSTSKREKVIVGKEAAQSIGIQKIREKCPHFHEWLRLLEDLREASCLEEG